MKPLSVGERVRVTSCVLDHVGRIVDIIEPFVVPQLKDRALMELPVYAVRLEDGSSVRYRGRDLERLAS